MIIDVVCIASGPSLTAEDCEAVRQSGVKVIAVNNSWEIAPFCDYLYAGDKKWWIEYNNSITIGAERWTCSSMAATAFKLNFHKVGGSYNSGMRAIQFAMFKGFKSIALLGYDCSLVNGIHWHGKHTGRFLRNPSQMKLNKWFMQFERVAQQAKDKDVTIYNCSRYSELKCFERIGLEKALNDVCDK